MPEARKIEREQRALAQRSSSDRLEREAAEVAAKIAAGYEKLAEKFRRKSQQAAGKVKGAKGETKRLVYRRQFELYGDAALDLDERASGIRSRREEPGE